MMNYTNLSKDDIRKICNEEYQSPENAILRNWINKKYFKRSEAFKRLKELYYSYLDLKKELITFSEWYWTIYYKPVWGRKRKPEEVKENTYLIIHNSCIIQRGREGEQSECFYKERISKTTYSEMKTKAPLYRVGAYKQTN